jgi:hypothetical protein
VVSSIASHKYGVQNATDSAEAMSQRKT